MVDFTLTDEQKDLRELAHDFAEKEIRPVAWELDKDGGWLYVRRQWLPSGEYGPPKTKAGERRIALPNDLRDELIALAPKV